LRNWLDCSGVVVVLRIPRSCSAGIACRVAWLREGMFGRGRGRYLTFGMGGGR
jgi:hypothetical protein